MTSATAPLAGIANTRSSQKGGEGGKNTECENGKRRQVWKGKRAGGEGEGEMRNVLFPGGAESEVAKCWRQLTVGDMGAQLNISTL